MEFIRICAVRFYIDQVRQTFTNLKDQKKGNGGDMAISRRFGSCTNRKFTVIRRWLLLSVMFLNFFPLQYAHPSPLVDQQQPVIDPTVGGLAIGGSSQQKLAQVVTAGVSGSLTEVRFPVACDPAANLIVEIQGVTGNKPNGDVLTSQTIPGSNLPVFFPSPPSFRSMVFSTPVDFSAGSQFAIVLRAAGSCGVFRGPVGDSYPGGNAFFDSLPNPPGWVCICEFQGDRFDLPFQTLAESTLPVSIDIKPGNSPNSINLRSSGVVPVAILSSSMFDATQVNPETVTLAGAKVKLIGKGDRYSCSPEDVNEDGLADLVCHVKTADFLIEPGDSIAILEAETFNGKHIRGEDSIQIVAD
jgi:hypothetical protein